MAAPVGVTKGQVVDAASTVLAEAGAVDAVTLGGVAARLGIRTQSLYAHVDGLAGLRRELALRGLAALGERLAGAAAGRSGAAAIEGIVRAYLQFAEDEPGLYEASLRPPGDDAEVRGAMAAVMRPLLAVFESYGLDAEIGTHWYRIVFASVYGLAGLRRASLLTLPAPLDQTVELLVEALVRGIEDAV